MKDRRLDADQILREVRENAARLRSCPKHDFVGMPSEVLATCKDGGQLFRRFKCTRCGGTVDSHGHHWYEQGRAHGGAP